MTKSWDRKALAFGSLEVYKGKEKKLYYTNQSYVASATTARIFIGPFGPEFVKSPTFSVQNK